MKLIISREVVGKISDFAEKYAAQGTIFEELKITIQFTGVSIVFFQPERYSQLITCYFDFGDDVQFFFEDVFSAIEEQLHAHQTVADEHPVNVDVLTQNNSYVRQVLDYCGKNFDLLTCIPPPWFQKATSLSDAATRKNFPDIADEDMRKKRELWESWQQ